VPIGVAPRPATFHDLADLSRDVPVARDDAGVADVEISGESIPLGAFLKLAGVIESGGDAKQRIMAGEVTVNGEPETRRGRKLHRGDVVTLGEERLQIV
jgi:ribosome-associated protein